jgi:hypothetical protein
MALTNAERQARYRARAQEARALVTKCLVPLSVAELEALVTEKAAGGKTSWSVVVAVLKDKGFVTS